MSDISSDSDDSERKDIGASNPFDGSDMDLSTKRSVSSFDSDDEEETTVSNSISKMSDDKNAIHMLKRGALISGVKPSDNDREVPAPMEEDDDDDLESGIGPPDSDYASRVPRSLWALSNYTTGTGKNPFSMQPHRSTVSGEKRKKSKLFLALGCLSLVLVAAIIGVAIAVSGGDDGGNKSGAANVGTGNDGGSSDQGNGSGGSVDSVDVPVPVPEPEPVDTLDPTVLDERQNLLYDTVVGLSNQNTFLDAKSPQFQARNWLLFEDDFWMTPNLSFTSTRITQRYALATFYFATDGPVSWKDTSWLQDDECSGDFWFGISCNEGNEVRAIAFGRSCFVEWRPGWSKYFKCSLTRHTPVSSHSIDGHGLVGSIPPEVGHLSSMENLVLKHELLTGEIPSSIGHLSSLLQLGLYHNKLSGTIPFEMFRLKNLQYLNLQDNDLMGTLSPQIEFLGDLETLVLEENKFEGYLPFENLARTSVKLLGLGKNQFSGSIPDVFQSFSDLSYLYLDGNDLKGEIPASIGLVKQLKSLNFDHNSLTGSVPSSLGELTELEYLSIQKNDLNGTLPVELGGMSSLTTLNLAMNALTGALPDLSNLTLLVNLYLYENEITGPIPESIARLDSLSKFRGPPLHRSC